VTMGARRRTARISSVPPCERAMGHDTGTPPHGNAPKAPACAGAARRSVKRQRRVRVPTWFLDRHEPVWSHRRHPPPPIRTPTETRVPRRLTSASAAARRRPRWRLRCRSAQHNVKNRPDRAVGCTLCWAANRCRTAKLWLFEFSCLLSGVQEGKLIWCYWECCYFVN